MFAAILAFLPGFLLKFVGSGVLDTVLAHQRAKLDSANERERIDVGREVKRLENEQARRETIAKLQALEYQHWALWWPKMLIGFAVAQYVVISFVVRSLNLSADYNIIVPELTAWQAGIAVLVTGYYFIAK
jgi:hypothetical protein